MKLFLDFLHFNFVEHPQCGLMLSSSIGGFVYVMYRMITFKI